MRWLLLLLASVTPVFFIFVMIGSATRGDEGLDRVCKRAGGVYIVNTSDGPACLRREALIPLPGKKVK